jgi:hypothetical protein
MVTLNSYRFSHWTLLRVILLAPKTGLLRDFWKIIKQLVQFMRVFIGQEQKGLKQAHKLHWKMVINPVRIREK